MALRTFRAHDGTLWTMWLVKSAIAGAVSGMPAEWLAFQNEDGSERCRLLDIPDNWAELPDERLELLRRTCAKVPRLSGRHSPPDGMEHLRATVDEGANKGKEK